MSVAAAPPLDSTEDPVLAVPVDASTPADADGASTPADIAAIPTPFEAPAAADAVVAAPATDGATATDADVDPVFATRSDRGDRRARCRGADDAGAAPPVTATLEPTPGEPGGDVEIDDAAETGRSTTRTPRPTHRGVPSVPILMCR